MAAPPLGSGGRFAALEGKLAARGARNPAALAAFIGRRKYGKKGMAALSSKGTAGAPVARLGAALKSRK